VKRSVDDVHTLADERTKLTDTEDPNKWFNNVEIVVAERSGAETTTYVRNVYKYYVPYKLTLDAQAEAEKARQQVAPTKK
jgi:hypothetical protein